MSRITAVFFVVGVAFFCQAAIAHPIVKLQVDLPFGIVSAGLNLLADLARSIISIFNNLAPSVYKELNKVLDEIIKTLNELVVTSPSDIMKLLDHIVNILQGGVDSVDALLDDVSKTADKTLGGITGLVASGLKIILHGLTFLIPFAKKGIKAVNVLLEGGGIVKAITVAVLPFK